MLDINDDIRRMISLLKFKCVVMHFNGLEFYSVKQ